MALYHFQLQPLGKNCRKSANCAGRVGFLEAFHSFRFRGWDPDRPSSKLGIRFLICSVKTQKITAIFTSLTAAGALEASEVSSLMDTWLLLKNIEVGGERNRALYVLKSRGMEHSNQIREFVLTDDGLRLLDIYLGPEGVLTGSALAQHRY
jgi:hypothetical protein